MDSTESKNSKRCKNLKNISSYIFFVGCGTKGISFFCGCLHWLYSIIDSGDSALLLRNIYFFRSMLNGKWGQWVGIRWKHANLTFNFRRSSISTFCKPISRIYSHFLHAIFVCQRYDAICQRIIFEWFRIRTIDGTRSVVWWLLNPARHDIITHNNLH